MRARTVFNCCTLALFAAALCAPSVDQLLRPASERDPRSNEDREPAPRPPLPQSFPALSAFPRAYDAWYSDTFGLRDLLLRWNSRVCWQGLGASPNETAVQGTNGWAFYGGLNSRDVYRGVLPASSATLEQWVAVLKQRRALVEECGAKYLYVLCPSKEAIYPEFAPPTWKQVGPSRFQQLAARLAQEPGFPFLDLRPALLAAKSADRPGDSLYTDYGTHWNGRGTYVVYRAILEHLRADFGGIEVRERAELLETRSGGTDDSLGRQLYINDLLPCSPYGLTTPLPRRFEYGEVTGNSGEDEHWSSRGSGAGPRLVWFHDSFGPYLNDLFADAFQRIDSLWLEQFEARFVYELEPELVLETYVDRSLYLTPPDKPVDRAGRRVSWQVFENAPTAWVFQASEAARAPLRPFGGARMELQGGVLSVTCAGEQGGFLLPLVDLPAGRSPELLLEARVAGRTYIDVYVRPARAKDFLPRNHGWGQLSAEVQSVRIALPAVGARYETLVSWRTATPAQFTRIELRHPPKD